MVNGRDVDLEREASTDPEEASPASEPGQPSEALSPRQRQVETLLTRLAATGRGFLLYDIRNDAISRSLAALLEALEQVLAVEPQLRLDVKPFELEFEGRRVYLDRDRERSLAFRLYRDGVRVLVFRSGFDGDELVRLLQILSMRYTGIHQQEDDAVTLLWKAGLRSLDVIAVEGLAPEGGGPDGEGSLPLAEPRPYLPDNAPPPVPPDEATPEWLEIEPEALAGLRAEISSGTLPQDTLRLLEGLAAGLADPVEHMRFSEVVHLCEEMRDFLLSADRVPELLRFVRQLEELAGVVPEWDPERGAALRGLLQSCGSDRAVHRLIHSAPEGQSVVPRELQELLEHVCPDPLSAVAEALAVEDRPSARAVARQLLEIYGEHRSEQVRQRFDGAQGRVAADFLRSLARLEGEAAAVFVAHQCAHPDHEVREEALWHLERTAYTPAVGHAFVDAVRRTGGEHRRRVLALVERSRDRRFVQPLIGLVESMTDTAEAVEIARVIGRLEGPAALKSWRPWLTPGGRFFVRRLAGSSLLQAAAAAAVAQVPGEDATRLLRLALSAAGAAARPWIEQALASRGEAARGEGA